MSITASADAWDVTATRNGKPTRLLATLHIDNASLHLQAFRVKVVDHIQVAYDDDDAEDLDALYMLDPNDTYQDYTIPGFPGTWIIYAIPFK